MEDHIDIKTKEERLHELNELVNKYSLENNKKYEGKVVKVLIEGISEKDDNKVFGYTETMKLVNVDNAKDDIGRIINVKINVEFFFRWGKVRIKGVSIKEILFL